MLQKGKPMKKHLMSALVAIVVLFTMGLPVSAINPSINSAASRQFRAGFVQDNKAYVYLQLEQNQLADVDLQLKVNESVIPQLRSGYIREGDKPVHYLLLVDCSSTVRAYKEEIALFAYDLLEETTSGGGAAKISVAGLGDSFRILSESCTDLEVLHTTLDALNYNDSNTDLYGGIQEALAYIKSQPHSAGELYQIILVTDGRQDKQGQLGLTEEQLDELETSFIQRQDIIFHTYGVSEEWHNQELQQAELGRGRHLSMVETLPEEAAQTIASFTNSLYQGVFELNTEIVPAPGESLTIQVLYGDQPGGTSVVDIFSLGAAIESDSETENDFQGETITDEDQEGLENRQDPPEGETSGIEGEQGEVSAETDELTNEQNADSRGGIGIWLIIPVAVLAAISGWLLRRQVMESGNRSPKTPTPPPPGSVCLHIQVERGRCLTRDRNLYLVQELIIGRSQECDLVFDEPEIANRNSRIIKRDGDIYIEDLDSPKGTSIGGMRIYAPNRLRSGDVITIGAAVQIRVEYDKN